MTDFNLGQVLHTDLTEPLDVTNKALHTHTPTGENVDLATLLTNFNAEDFATQATLSALNTAFGNEDFSSEITLASVLTKLTELDNKIDAISNADNMNVTQVGSFVSEIFADNVEIINATYHFFPGNSTGFSGHTQTKVLTPKKTITIINNFDVSFTYYLVVSNIKSESAKNQIAALTLASGANISISGKDYAELDKPWKYLSVGLNCTSVPSSGSVNIVVGGNY